MTHIEKNKTFYIISAIFGVYILLSVPHLVNENPWAPDADRISMDGVFILDFIRDMPGSLVNIYDYTIEYYAKYPALSIGYRPAFFPLVEAFFYYIFGLHHISAKMAVFLFLFAGMLFWFLLVREIYDIPTALLSLLLWLTNPVVYQYSQQTMLEIPTLSMCIVCVYYLYIYEKAPSVSYGIILGTVVGLTLWTNQKSGFILFLLLIYPFVKKNSKLLFARNTWISAGIILAFLIPLICITLWLGDQNLEQSIGARTGGKSWFSSLRLFKNIYFLYHYHFSFLILAMAFAGMVFSFIRRDSECLIFVVVILCVYLFFTIIRVKISRYPMYWIPFFCIFAAIGFQKLIWHLEQFLKTGSSFIKYAICAFPVILQLCFLPNVFVGYAGGYEEAAKYVLEKTASPVIFFEGYANGQFIFFARKHDTDRQFVILRGDKILSSSSISHRNKLKIHLHDREEIYKALSDFGVHFVVVESADISNIKIYRELRNLLRDTSLFKLHKTIQVESNNTSLKNQNLLVYENLGYKKDLVKDQILNLRLPIVGKTIKMKLKKILR